MEEPTVGLLRRGDFDDGAVIPVGRAEFAQLVDSPLDGIENPAVPLARLTVAVDAVARMPAAAIDLPRHLRVAADVVEVVVFLARGFDLCGVVFLPFDERPGGEHRSEGGGGVENSRRLLFVVRSEPGGPPPRSGSRTTRLALIARDDLLGRPL